MHHTHRGNVAVGNVRWSPAKSLWWTGMVCASVIGGWLTFSWGALTLFLVATATVLLFGHSLGSHRKLIHDSFGCPTWLEYAWPGSAKLGVYPGEWDPGWWVLVLLERAGWAWRLKLPADCPARPELRSHGDGDPVAASGPRVSALSTLRSAVAASVRLLAGRGNAVLQGPCVGLSEQSLRRLAGASVHVVRAPAQARLVLRYDGDRNDVRGLPAVLIAIGSRNVWTAAGAIVLLPLATMCEIVRGQFQA